MHGKACKASGSSSFNLERLQRELLIPVNDQLMTGRQKLNHLKNILHALDPKNLLKRGIVFYLRKMAFQL